MIEQFFDICRLYPLGRFTRSWNRFWAFSEDSARQWSKDYTAEMQKGIVLLQRQEYLKSRRKEIVTTLQQRGQPDDFKVTYSICNELEEIEAKIDQVQVIYLAHEERMRILWPKFKSNIFSREALMAQKPQYRLIAGRQPYSWVQTRNRCSDSGGCCGRACGCCEKPLKVVIEHGSSLFGQR